MSGGGSLTFTEPPLRTVGEWLEDAIALLERGEVESARLSAYLILEEITGHPRSRLIAFPETCLNSAEMEKANELLFRRTRHEPMAYILGSKEFRNLTLKVAPAVLIPRPESEGLVDRAAEIAPGAERILDAGTGSGCLALSLAEAFPRARVFGCDRSRAALEVARENDAMRKVDWFESEWLSPIAREGLDLVVSNPPYLTDAEVDTLAPQVARYEPVEALRGGPDGCDAYRILIPQAGACLRPGGRILLEISPTVVREVGKLLERTGFKEVLFHHDLAGRERYAAASLPD